MSTRFSKTFNILLVEDSPGDMYLARRALARSRMDVELTFAQTGAEALTRLGGDTFDLVLLDINLGDMSGFDVLSKMRTEDSIRVSPTFVLTTSRDQSDQDRATELQAIGFASKPRSFGEYDDLVGVLEKVMLQTEKTA